jgi:hypothetical protein
MTLGAESADISPASPDGLDLTKDEPQSDQPSDRPLVTTKPFDPHRMQERVRTGVALAVIAAVILETLIITFAFVFKAIPSSSLSSVTATIITPMIGIAGTVLGFYFGSHRPGPGS